MRQFYTLVVLVFVVAVMIQPNPSWVWNSLRHPKPVTTAIHRIW